VPAFARRQAVILDALWRVLAAGGKLLYVTCSVFAGRTAVVARSLAHAGSGRMPARAPAQLLPGPNDGFFFALLTRDPEAGAMRGFASC
jgi:16S rRNA (cytosine967-C5)-methyltransferase